MKAIYFATRTLAREAKDELNGQFKDFGTTAPKGERWAVLVEEAAEQPQNEVPEVKGTTLHSQNDNVTYRNHLRDMHEKAVLHKLPEVSFTPGIKRREVLTTPNNKPVRTLWRRSMVAVRLAAHLANS